MREELNPIWDAVTQAELPSNIIDLFGACWDESLGRFTVQETYILDYKDRAPEAFSEDFGASIIRIALGFYNSYGGIVVFGITDRTMMPSGLSTAFDVEGFNRLMTEVSGLRIECLLRDYILPGTDGRAISVLLVPRRGKQRPARLIRDFGPYRAGSLWVRDRHQVVLATAAHIPTLYSARTSLPSDAANDAPLPIHRSLPPSPATMHEFIGREALMADLWDWFVFGDQPRQYVHGPGGSGKSTLAFEFARLLADTGFDVHLPNGERVDYVLYLSAKESELNPVTGRQQEFSLRQFSDPISQFAQILYHSGHFDEGDVAEADEDQLLEMLGQLFSDYTGLIVLDDIDALSRRDVDTGEEPLFMKAVCGSKRTRILYTLRYPPSHARRYSLAVPGLNDDEFCEFLEACCTQFEVPPATAEIMPEILGQTSALPLLIETVVGLRKFCGSFPEALKQFRDRGGEDARRYLYQREYDRLSRDGKAREVMAALYHLKEPVTFATLANLLSIPAQRVTDALSECGNIFLATSEDAQGETLYQLSAPSRPFIAIVSERLNRADLIKRKVELFAREGARYTPAEAALIVRMERLIRSGEHSKIVELADSMSPHDPAFANPKILGLLGQSLANLGANHRERARECFRSAEALNHRDVYMMRAWYYMETRSGYGIEEARRICLGMLKAADVSPRAKAEFWSKLALCHFSEAQALRGVSPEKAISLMQQSIEAYLEALWLGGGLDQQQTIAWLERPVVALLSYCRGDVDPLVSMIEGLPARKHDISPAGAELIVHSIIKADLPNDASARKRLAGLFKRASVRLDRVVKDSPHFPGFQYLIDTFRRFSATLSDVLEAAE